MKQAPITLQLSTINSFRFNFDSSKISEENFPFNSFREAGLASKVQIGTSDDDPLDMAVKLEVSMEGDGCENVPFTFSIEVEGFFRVSEKTQKDKINAIISANGPAVLYGSIRELILQMSSRNNYPITLPTVNFLPSE